jgi:hypothetical protein
MLWLPASEASWHRLSLSAVDIGMSLNELGSLSHEGPSTLTASGLPTAANCATRSVGDRWGPCPLGVFIAASTVLMDVKPVTKPLARRTLRVAKRSGLRLLARIPLLRRTVGV